MAEIEVGQNIFYQHHKFNYYCLDDGWFGEEIDELHLTKADKLVVIDSNIIDQISRFNKLGYYTESSCEGSADEDNIGTPYIQFKPLSAIKLINLMGICLRLNSMNISAEKATDHDGIEKDALYSCTISMSSRFINYCFKNGDEDVDPNIFNEYKELWLNDLKIILRLIGCNDI